MGRSALTGIGAGLVAVCLVAIGSRLLALGPGDADLVSTFPSSAGRLSYPTGYWNALGAMAAMAVPVLVWLATEVRRRPLLGIVLAGFVPVLLVAYMTSSRGALIAAALGSGLVIAATPERGRALASALVGVVAALPAIIVAAAAAGIVDSPGTAVGRPELEVCGAMIIGFAIAVGAGPPVIERLGGMRFRGVRMRHVLVASVALLAVLLALVGPGRIAGDFAAKSGRRGCADRGHRRPVVGIGVGAGAVLGFGPRRIRIGSGQGDRHGQLPDLLEPARWSRDAGPECPLRAPGAARGGRAARLSRLLHLLRRRCRNRNPPGPRTRRRTGGGVSRRPGDRPRGAAHRLDLGRPIGDGPAARRRGVDLRASAGSRRRGDGARRSAAQPVLRPAADSGSGARARSGRDRVRRPRRRRRPRPGRNDEPAAEQRRRARPRPARCGRRGRTIGGRDPALVVDPVAEARDDRARRRQRPRRPRASSDGRSISLPTISASGCSRLRSSRASATTRSSALTRSERSHSRRWSYPES